MRKKVKTYPMKNDLTFATLDENLHYDPDTGHFIRRKSAGQANIGDIAGSKDRRNYIRIGVAGRVYMAHRLVFLYMTGKFPPEFVDHINGDRTDNRWANLREADGPQNSHNAKMRKDNTSGIKGVSWSNTHQKWYAQLMVNGKLMNLKYHDTIEAAAAAVQTARIAHHMAYADHGTASETPLAERIKNRAARKPRTEKWVQTSVRAKGEIPTTVDHVKASNIRLRLASGYYEAELAARLAGLPCIEMKKLPEWPLLNTKGDWYKEKAGT